MHIYCNGQQFNISSVYTSENIEEVINHLLDMNLKSRTDIVHFFRILCYHSSTELFLI